MASMDTLALGAVVLAGGTAARMGGVDKASIELHGRSLLAHALDAVIDAGEVVVLGDWVPTERPVTFTREDPPLGGPAAGLLHGLDCFAREPSQLVVLAVDMPFVTMGTIGRLRAAAAEGAAPTRAEGAAFTRTGGAVLTDADGRRQLAMVLDTAALSAVRPPREEEFGLPLHRLLAGLRLVDVAAEGQEARDVDSWTDLRDLR